MCRGQIITPNGYPKGRNCYKCKYNALKLSDSDRLVRFCSLTDTVEKYPAMIQVCNKFILDRKKWVDLKHRVVEHG